MGGPLFSRLCHCLILCLLVPPVWERPRSVAVGSASSPLSGDVTPYTFPSHPIASSSTLTVCVASPSLHVGSLTQACRILRFLPARVPIAPPCAGKRCSSALRSCQYYSVGGPLFSWSCHCLTPCPLVPPVWERARSVAVGSASSLLSGDVTLHTFPSRPIHHYLFPSPLLPHVLDSACSLAHLWGVLRRHFLGISQYSVAFCRCATHVGTYCMLCLLQ